MSNAATLDKTAAAPAGVAPSRSAAQARRRRLLIWLAIAVVVYVYRPESAAYFSKPKPGPQRTDW